MQIASRTFLGSACVDLHVHSNASDGSLSVRQLIKKAEDIGLKAMAVTDHDTVDGVCEALDHPPSAALEILSGIEISVDHPSGGMHLLGYLFQTDAPSLRKVLQVLQEARKHRNLQIIENLQAMGIDVTYEEVREIAVRGQIGRPHFARALVQAGIVGTMEEAFRRFLRRGRPAYASRYRLTCKEAIDTILEAGGVPVLAHPGSLGLRRESELETLLLELRGAGLKGLEVYYTDHTEGQQAMYERLADRLELAMTGGTDFHGDAKPRTHLGIGRGDLRIPYRVVEVLKKLQGGGRL